MLWLNDTSYTTAKVSEGTNGNMCARNTLMQLLAAYTNPESQNAPRYRQTNRHTDGQQAAANSRSYCVAVRSAKNKSSYFLAPYSRDFSGADLHGGIYLLRFMGEGGFFSERGLCPMGMFVCSSPELAVGVLAVQSQYQLDAGVYNWLRDRQNADDRAGRPQFLSVHFNSLTLPGRFHSDGRSPINLPIRITRCLHNQISALSKTCGSAVKGQGTVTPAEIDLDVLKCAGMLICPPKV